MAGTKRSASAEPSSPRASKGQKTSPQKTPPPQSPRRSPRRSLTGSQGSPAKAQQTLVKSDGFSRIKPASGLRRVQPERNLSGPLNEFPPVASAFSKGFPNRGVDCYRSAVLAALFHVPAFYRYMGIIHNDCNLQALTCLLCRLQDLCYNHWDRSDTHALPGEVHRIATTLYTAFHQTLDSSLPVGSFDLSDDIVNGRQSDAREFLDYLLREQIKCKQSPQDSISYDQMFELVMKESWTCSECEETHSQIIPTMSAGLYIPLDVEGARSGRSLQWMMMASGLFSTTSERRCATQSCMLAERDSQSPEREVKMTIVRAPEVLIIGLGRFAYNQRKLFTRIHCPEFLDLNDFRESAEVTGDVRYRLDAVVAHQGRTIEGGHYIAAVRKHHQPGFEVVDDMRIGPTRDGGLMEIQKPRTEGREDADLVVLMYSKL